MNAGLSNLATLKAHLLPGTWQSVTDYDAAIAALGLGMAGLLETFTGRKFERTVGAVEYFDGANATLQLTRLPLETLTALDIQTEKDGDWTSILTAVKKAGKTGLVYLTGQQAEPGDATIRATFTGGYWFDTTENNSGSLPSGATAVPAKLLAAWKLQCGAVWARTDTDAQKAGLASGNLNALNALINETKLLPVVEQMCFDLRMLAA